MFDRKVYMKQYNHEWHLKNGAARNKKQAPYKKNWYIDNRLEILQKRKEVYLKNPAITAVQTKKWRKENPAKHAVNKRIYHLKRSFGISVAKYNEMLIKQNGVCAICFKEQIGGISLAVDHRHSDGKIRGLLCNICNRGIGMFKDNADHLLQAVKYLKESYD